MASSFHIRRSPFNFSSLILACSPFFLTEVTARDGHSLCPVGSDECGGADEQELLQRSVVSRIGGSDVDDLLSWQPPGFQDADRGAASVAIRAQVQALGGTCGQDVTALAGTGGRCPEECPLLARDLSSENGGGEGYCTFSCVPATEAACVAYSPGEPIPDESRGFCRACAIQGCNECVEPSNTMSLSEMNKCGVCSAGYTLLEDGTCDSMYRYLWYILFTVIGGFIFTVSAWLYDLCSRPIINNEGLERGLATRSRAKLHTPKRLNNTSESGVTPRGSILALAMDSGRKLWPLTTNLCTTMVAGPGLTLHFNYMAMIILWSVGILVSWVVFAYYTDVSLFSLGVRGARTPAETCAVIAWGHETQQRLMWAKVCFAGGCYLWSFGLFMVFSVRQLRVFRTLHEEETTHMDFCCILEGLPALSGDELVEDLLCAEIERSTGHKPVGVSMAWEIGAVHEDLMSIIDEGLDELHDEGEMAAEQSKDQGAMAASQLRKQTTKEFLEEQVLAPRKSVARKSVSKMNALDRFSASASNLHNPSKSPRTPRTPRTDEARGFRRMLMAFERAFLSKTVQSMLTRGKSRRNLNEEEANRDDIDIEEELRALHSSSTCFVVFDSVAARDSAVEHVKKTGGVCFRGSVLSASKAQNEPESVNWANFKDEHIGWTISRVFLGITTIILALIFWTVCFYLPYAFYFMSFNYSQGQSPGVLEQATFALIIVCGNASMYFLCSEVSNRCSFTYMGDRELCYMLLYVFSCTLNILLDLICAYKVAFMALVGTGSRTHDGVLLEDLVSFTDRFESYPMQRDLGWTVFAYSFPCTFLIPFIAQPIFTIYLPYKIMTAIVGHRRDITGSRADVFLGAMPFDLSRYADIALNVVLCSLVFWFPSGLNIFMFACFTLSHIYVFCADQYRVLRACPAFTISTMNTDWWAQAMLAVPCGMIGACTLFKANCVEDFRQFHLDRDEGVFGYCKENEALVAKCAAFFTIHVVVHLVVLFFVVPLFAAEAEKALKTSYSECARRLAHSWFSVNPVHCLRSEYIYEHEPPWVFSRGGKEHLMPQNPEIGAFFCDTSAQCEDYSASIETTESFKLISKAVLRNPRSQVEQPQMTPASPTEFNFDHDPDKPVLISPRRGNTRRSLASKYDSNESSPSSPNE